MGLLALATTDDKELRAKGLLGRALRAKTDSVPHSAGAVSRSAGAAPAREVTTASPVPNLPPKKKNPEHETQTDSEKTLPDFPLEPESGHLFAEDAGVAGSPAPASGLLARSRQTAHAKAAFAPIVSEPPATPVFDAIAAVVPETAPHGIDLHVPFPSFDLDEATGAIDSIPLTFEYPVVLYDLVKDILNIERGAFLFRQEDSGLYVPLALDGFDATSARRLRIPSERMDSFGEAKATQLTDAALADFRMFLSHADMSRIDALRIVPIDFGNSGKAFILSAETLRRPESALLPPEWNMMRAFLGERITIYSARYGTSLRQGSTRSAAVITRQDLDASLEALSSEGCSSRLALVSLEPFLEAVKRRNPQADRFRLYREAATVMSGILPPPGKLFSLSRFRLAFLFAGQGEIDVELLLHQLSSSVRRIFAGNSDFNLEAQAIIDPAREADKIDQVLDNGRHKHAAS